MTRVAAVDCGTNSIRLLVADVDASGGMRDVVRRMEIVRLGQDIDRTGMIAPEAMQRTLRVVAEYAAQCAQLRAERVRFVATSASRDARNAADFVAGVIAAFAPFDVFPRVEPEVVTGAEEAGLSFRGATAGLAATAVPGPYLVVDLGGGSTELVLGTSSVDQSVSLDIGSVRMMERYLHSDPPSPEEIAAAERDIDAQIDVAARQVDLSRVAALVGVAGTITTVTAHALGLTGYVSSAIHLSRLPVERVTMACTELLEMPRAEKAALPPYMHPGRVDVIGAGALIWRAVVQRLVHAASITEVITSEHDILDGIALSIA